MGFIRYYWTVLSLAIRHSLTPTQNIIFVLFILAGALATWLPKVDVNGWQVATLVLGVIVGCRLLLAPYWLHKNDQDTIKKLKATIEDRRNKREIRTQLGAFAMEARGFMLECDDESKPLRTAEMAAWQNKVQEYLQTNLELSYVARFRSPAGTPILPKNINVHQRAKEGMKFRNGQLVEFIKEFAD